MKITGHIRRDCRGLLRDLIGPGYRLTYRPDEVLTEYDMVRVQSNVERLAESVAQPVDYELNPEE